jgi:hypothetical protein
VIIISIKRYINFLNKNILNGEVNDMDKEKLLQMQFALFFLQPQARPDLMIQKINEIFEDRFDQMPVIIPLPDQAPIDIPIVNMRNSKGDFFCNISKGRLDIIFNFGLSDEITNKKVENFMHQIKSFAKAIMNYKEMNRFGIIAQYFIPSVESIKEIQNKYYKVQLNDLAEISVRYNRRRKLDILDLNDIIEIKDVTIQSDNGTEKGIFIVRDFNNVVNTKTNITYDEINSVIIKYMGLFQTKEILELIK